MPLFGKLKDSLGLKGDDPSGPTTSSAESPKTDKPRKKSSSASTPSSQPQPIPSQSTAPRTYITQAEDHVPLISSDNKPRYTEAASTTKTPDEALFELTNRYGDAAGGGVIDWRQPNERATRKDGDRPEKTGREGGGGGGFWKRKGSKGKE